ncbi:LOW QUALITY PROTEIN: arp2/3 complex-activating protein rickA [Drosophila obscura]|uniref:LOW QUALITY PROTEIN: arp2/3 complex-activating protein rickA n=1 Tax=Drosophila obscura TaxID=7282 RepID=UPI001BB27E6A|nr:LOW QUALITY PROTEIN: arp2/3 complex-activating protein rickA [Drosophila obscura]
MFKLIFSSAAVLLCAIHATAQVVPNAEIGRVTIQVPLLSNGKPVLLGNHESVEVARVEEIKPGKIQVVNDVVVPPTLSKVRSARSIVDHSNPGILNEGIPNPGIPNAGIPNRGIPSAGIPNPGIPNEGIPNRGIPNAGIPNRGIPNEGIPNPGIPNEGIPNPGIPNAGIPNRIPNRGIPNEGIPNPGIPNKGIPNPGIPNHGIPIPDASVIQPVAVMPTHRSTTSPTMTTVLPRRVPSKNCHHLLLAGMTTVSPLETIATPPAENCDELCTKHEYMPICAHNGVCVHEFANQCVMDTFNCKHRDLSFRSVDEDVCRLELCARRCKEEDLKL